MGQSYSCGPAELRATRRRGPHAPAEPSNRRLARVLAVCLTSENLATYAEKHVRSLKGTALALLLSNLLGAQILKSFLTQSDLNIPTGLFFFSSSLLQNPKPKLTKRSRTLKQLLLVAKAENRSINLA